MPAYNAAQTLERTYADIPHDLVERIILVDDVSKDETVEIARQLGLDVIIHPQNRGYGGNQKTCYDARSRGRRGHRRDAPPGLPVRRDAHPRAHRPDRRRDPRPDARQPIPRRPAGRRHAASGSTSATGSSRRSRTSPSSCTCPSTTPACAPTAGGCSRPSRTSATATTSCSTRSSSPRSWPPACAGRIGEIAVPTRYFEEAELGRLPSAASSTASRRSGSSPATCSIACASGARRS